MARLINPEELRKFREKLISQRDAGKTRITLCCGSACNASGSMEVAARIEEEIQAQGLTGEVEIRKTGCHGFCERGPIIVHHPDEITYLKIKPEDVPEIVSKAGKGTEMMDRLLYTDPDTKEKIIQESEIPFYKHQKRLVFGSNGSIDPKIIDDYLAIGGYSAIVKIFSGMTPEAVLDEVKKS
ncbi:MAG: NAD(P)H-dependent oxidoreductase subunit E, partial [Bacteroidota bacterium]